MPQDILAPTDMRWQNVYAYLYCPYHFTACTRSTEYALAGQQRPSSAPEAGPLDVLGRN